MFLSRSHISWFGIHPIFFWWSNFDIVRCRRTYFHHHGWSNLTSNELNDLRYRCYAFWENVIKSKFQLHTAELTEGMHPNTVLRQETVDIIKSGGNPQTKTPHQV